MKDKTIHLVGIGGIGLSAIVQVLLARGVRVSGSDNAATPITEALARAGARVFQGHRADNITSDVDLVVVSSAVGAENPEVNAARARGIRVIKRREFLTELTEGYRTIAIAGSHGKTTTTALTGLMLADAGLDPVVVVGGIVPEFGSNARGGKGEYFVIEADEYRFRLPRVESVYRGRYKRRLRSSGPVCDSGGLSASLCGVRGASSSGWHSDSVR